MTTPTEAATSAGAPAGPPSAAPSGTYDLRHHGDAEVAPGLLDLAVNVRAGSPPAWLRARLAASLDDVAAYPDPRAARTAVAGHHARPEDEVLLTSGAAEAFVLLARALRPRRAVVVHPQFTEPEAALRAAGHHVERLLLPWPFILDATAVPDDADLVVVGNPTNPTSVLHPAATLAALARPGRTLVVDEAFADTVPGEPESLAGRRELPGLVVLRSLTKTWGLAGVRAGYLLAPSATVAQLADAQPLWSVSTPALAAVRACLEPGAQAEARAWAEELAHWRAYAVDRLTALPGVTVSPGARASFLLLRIGDAARVRSLLRADGVAVRRGDTFPGLGEDYVRVAVREPATTDLLVAALARVLEARR